MKNYKNKVQVIRLISIDSTNKYAMQWLENQNADDGTIIITQNQYAGKGLGYNKWESETNKNITLSVIYHPLFLPVDMQFMLNEVVSLSIVDFINKIAPKLNVKIKWPNDIYIKDKKVAGVLIENIINGKEFKSTIIGIGININQETFRFVQNTSLDDKRTTNNYKRLGNPTSLKLETGQDYNLDECLSVLTNTITKRYNSLKDENTTKIQKDYIKNLYRFNKFAGYLYKNNKITAKITGISNYGHLILEKKDKTIIQCDLKEVEFII